MRQRGNDPYPMKASPGPTSAESPGRNLLDCWNDLLYYWLSRMMALLRRTELLVPAIYLIAALALWIDFARTPPDGLANVGIALYTLPNFFIIRYISGLEFPFFEGSYYSAHAMYFAANVLINAFCLYGIIRFVKKRREKRREERSLP